MVYAIVSTHGLVSATHCYHSSWEGDWREEVVVAASFEAAVLLAEQAKYGYKVISHHWELPLTTYSLNTCK